MILVNDPDVLFPPLPEFGSIDSPNISIYDYIIEEFRGGYPKRYSSQHKKRLKQIVEPRVLREILNGIREPGTWAIISLVSGSLLGLVEPEALTPTSPLYKLPGEPNLTSYYYEIFARVLARHSGSRITDEDLDGQD